jgi:chromosome segregation ATPase
MELFASTAELSPGEYEFHLRGRLRAAMPRNPRAIEQAKARDEKLAGLLQAAADTGTQLASARNAAQSELDAARARHAEVETELAAARQSLDMASQEQETEASRLTDAQTQLQVTAGVGEPSFATLDASRQKLLTSIETARAAKAKLIDVEAAWASCKVAADVTAARLAALERQLQAAEQAKQQLEERKQQAATRLEEAKQQNEPREYEFELLSQPVRVRIVAAPFELALASSRMQAVQGQIVELPIHIERKYGFEGEVEIKLAMQSGGPVSAEAVRISPDAQAATLRVQVPPESATGRHACEIEATGEFNGVPVKKRMSFQLAIGPVS